MCGWQVKLCDPSLTHAIPEHLRDEFLMKKRYTNLHLLYFTLYAGTLHAVGSEYQQLNSHNLTALSSLTNQTKLQTQLSPDSSRVQNMKTHHSSMLDFLDVGSFFNLTIQTQFFADFRRHQRPKRCSVPTPATNRLPSAENWRLFTKPTCIGKTHSTRHTASTEHSLTFRVHTMLSYRRVTVHRWQIRPIVHN